MANGWIPFYCADYLADTSDLSLAEHGAYILLMAHYYQTRRPLDANASVLHRICRCENDADRAAVARVIDKFFVFQVDAYHNNRIDRELAKSSEIRNKRSKAAEVRWKLEHASADAHAMQVDTHSHSQSHSQKDNTSSSAASAEPVAGTLPLIDGTEYQVTKAELDERQKLYPALDVRQEFRSMKGWLNDHPENRKTPRGIRKFIGGWLARAQDRARPVNAQNKTQERQRQGFDAIGQALRKRVGSIDGGHPEALPEPAIDP